MNLTQWREGAKAQRCDYCAIIPDFHPVIPDFHSVIPDSHPVIPAKAGIQRVGDAACTPPTPLDFGFQCPRALMSTHPRFFGFAKHQRGLRTNLLIPHYSLFSLRPPSASADCERRRISFLTTLSSLLDRQAPARTASGGESHSSLLSLLSQDRQAPTRTASGGESHSSLLSLLS